MCHPTVADRYAESLHSFKGVRCGQCHVPPDDENVADVLGIPLHGQRGVYLRYALQSYMDGRRENLLDAMKEKLSKIDASDIEALVNYYASY